MLMSRGPEGLPQKQANERGERVWLSLGSNAGNSLTNLRRAVHLLEQHPRISVICVSPVYRTAPWGVTGQPAFLNCAAEVETDLMPLELLEAAKRVEQCVGRQPRERWGPREIDIDLVLWPGRECISERLTLPHPRYRERAFVLIPLRDIAPYACDPATGEQVREMARQFQDADVERLGPLAPYADEEN